MEGRYTIIRNTHLGDRMREKSASIVLITKILGTWGPLPFYHIDFANCNLYFKIK